MAQTSVRQYAHKVGQTVGNFADNVIDQYPSAAVPGELILKNRFCAPIAGAVTIADVAYFVYLGRATRQLTPVRVLFAVSTGGTSTQVGEVGVFSSPTAPNRVGQVLTKIVANGSLDDLTGTGVLGNTAVFTASTLISAGTHLWAGYRVAMAGTEPTVYGLTGDMSQGTILSTAAAGVFTSGTTYTGALIAHSLAWQAPGLVLTIS